MIEEYTHCYDYEPHPEHVFQRLEDKVLICIGTEEYNEH